MTWGSERDGKEACSWTHIEEVQYYRVCHNVTIIDGEGAICYNVSIMVRHYWGGSHANENLRYIAHAIKFALGWCCRCPGLVIAQMIPS